MTESIGSATLDLRTDDAGFVKGIDGAHKRATKLEAQFERTGRKLQAVGRQAADVGKTMTTRLTIPVVAAFGGVAKAAGDIESGMIGVQKTTGLTDKAIRTLRDDLLDFAGSANVTTDNLIGTAQAAGQMGIEGADAIGDFTKSFAALEIASDRTIEGELGARTFAKFLELTNEGTEGAESMGSALVELGNTSKTTEGNILSLGIEIVSRASQFRLAGANVAGFATALDEAGVQSQRAASTFQIFFQTLDTAVKSGNENLQNFVDVTGLSVERIRELMRTNPSQLMIEFADGLNQLNVSGADTATLLEDMGLGAQRVSSVLQVMASRVDRVRDRVEVANRAQRENTALQAEFEQANRGFNSAMQQLGNSLKALAVAIADAGFIDWLKATAQQLRAWAQNLSNVNPEILKWATVIAGVTAVLGPATAALGFMTLGIGKFVTALGTARLALLPLAGPAGLILGTVAAFGVLGSALSEDLPASIDTAKEATAGLKEANLQLQEVLSDDTATDEVIKQTKELAKERLKEAKATLEQVKAQIEAARTSDALGLEFAKVSTGTLELARQSGKLQKEIERLEERLRGGTKAGEEFEGITIEITKSAEDFGDAVQRHFDDQQLLRLADAAGEAATSTAGIGEAAKKAGVDYSLLNVKIGSVEQSAREAAIAAGSISGEAANLARETKNVQDEQNESLDLWRTTDQIARDTVTGIRDAWVGMWRDALQGRIGSIKDFLKSVKAMFLSVIAEIAASWTASKVFGIGDFSLGKLNIGGGGGGGFGLGGLKAIGSKISAGAAKLFGAGSAASTAGQSAAAASGIHAGTGAATSAFSTANLAAAAQVIAPIALPFAAKALLGGGNLDPIIDQARGSFAGFQGQAGGLNIGAGGGFGFAGGEGLGFAAAVAKEMDIVNVKIGEGVRAFKDMTMQEMRTLAEATSQRFQHIKRVAVDAFGRAGVSARQMGKMMQDGVIDKADKAALGIQHIGAVIENPKTGMKELGDLSVIQFQKIGEAVNRGEIRLEALQGKVKLNAQEMRTLGQIGVGAHSKIVASARSAAGAEKSFGSAANSVMSSVRAATAATAKSFGQSFTQASQQARSGIRGLASDARSSLGSVAGAARSAASAIGSIPGKASSAAAAARKSFGSVSAAAGSIPHLAHGGIVTRPTLALIGEAGPEAVVPLTGGGRGKGAPMTINLTQNIQGVTPDEVEHQTRRALRRVAQEWPIS